LRVSPRYSQDAHHLQGTEAAWGWAVAAVRVMAAVRAMVDRMVVAHRAAENVPVPPNRNNELLN
jgi:hypothetical protein